jgi:ABC-type antimicrobial peptide transport system permease subunit
VGAIVFGAIGALGFALAAVGIYSMVAFSVGQQTREIGIRMALGADRSNIVWLIMREAGTLLGIGLVAGTALALMAGTAASALLFGLTPRDPWTLTVAALSLAFVAAAASFLPAQRAATLDPMQALREE